MSATKITITSLTVELGQEASEQAVSAIVEDLSSVLREPQYNDGAPVASDRCEHDLHLREPDRSNREDLQGGAPKTFLGIRVSDEAKTRFSDLCYQHRGETAGDVFIKLLDAYQHGRKSVPRR